MLASYPYRTFLLLSFVWIMCHLASGTEGQDFPYPTVFLSSTASNPVWTGDCSASCSFSSPCRMDTDMSATYIIPTSCHVSIIAGSSMTGGNFTVTDSSATLMFSSTGNFISTNTWTLKAAAVVFENFTSDSLYSLYFSDSPPTLDRLLINNSSIHVVNTVSTSEFPLEFAVTNSYLYMGNAWGTRRVRDAGDGACSFKLQDSTIQSELAFFVWGCGGGGYFLAENSAYNKFYTMAMQWTSLEFVNSTWTTAGDSPTLLGSETSVLMRNGSRILNGDSQFAIFSRSSMASLTMIDSAIIDLALTDIETTTFRSPIYMERVNVTLTDSAPTGTFISPYGSGTDFTFIDCIFTSSSQDIIVMAGGYGGFGFGGMRNLHIEGSTFNTIPGKNGLILSQAFNWTAPSKVQKIVIDGDTQFYGSSLEITDGLDRTSKEPTQGGLSVHNNLIMHPFHTNVTITTNSADNTHVIYVPSEDPSLSVQVFYWYNLASFDIDWRFDLPPIISTPYIFANNTPDDVIYQDYDSSGEYDISVSWSDGSTSFTFNPVDCPSTCITGHIGNCSSRNMCSCISPWAASDCSCNSTGLPAGAVCQDQTTWTYSGNFGSTSGSSLIMPTGYRFVISGELALAGSVALQKTQLSVSGDLNIVTSGRMSFYVKLRELRSSEVCIITGDTSAVFGNFISATGSEIDVYLDVTDISTDGSCVPPTPSESYPFDGLGDPIVYVTGTTVIQTGSVWKVRLVGYNETQTLSFKLPVANTLNLDGSSGVPTVIGYSGTSYDCVTIIGNVGYFGIDVQCAPPSPVQPSSSPVSPSEGSPISQSTPTGSACLIAPGLALWLALLFILF